MELELQAISKILVATLQIVGGLAASFNVTFPAVFTSFIREVVSVFRFDISGAAAAAVMAAQLLCVCPKTRVSERLRGGQTEL